MGGASGLIALVYLLGAFASPFPLHDPFAYLIWELQGVLQISLPVVFVWGLLSTRLARSAVGDLVVELERPLPPGELRASLARTLGDPVAGPAVRARRARTAGSTPTAGRGTAAAARAGARRAVTVVERDGRPLAALVHDPALDQGLVRAAAAAAGMAIENERLHAEVRAQLDEVRASRQRIVEAGDRRTAPGRAQPARRRAAAAGDAGAVAGHAARPRRRRPGTAAAALAQARPS